MDHRSDIAFLCNCSPFIVLVVIEVPPLSKVHPPQSDCTFLEIFAPSTPWTKGEGTHQVLSPSQCEETLAGNHLPSTDIPVTSFHMSPPKSRFTFPCGTFAQALTHSVLYVHGPNATGLVNGFHMHSAALSVGA